RESEGLDGAGASGKGDGHPGRGLVRTQPGYPVGSGDPALGTDAGTKLKVTQGLAGRVPSLYLDTKPTGSRIFVGGATSPRPAAVRTPGLIPRLIPVYPQRRRSQALDASTSSTITSIARITVDARAC